MLKAHLPSFLPKTTTKDNKGLFGLDRVQISNIVLIPGLKVDVDGTSDDQGRVVAKTITVDGDETAEMIQSGLTPTAEQVEKNVQSLAAHQDQLAGHQVQLAAQKESIEANQQNIAANRQRIQENTSDIRRQHEALYGAKRMRCQRPGDGEIRRRQFQNLCARRGGTKESRTNGYWPNRVHC